MFHRKRELLNYSAVLGALGALGALLLAAGCDLSGIPGICTDDSACDDGLPCTTGACVSGLCKHTVNTGWCKVGSLCYASAAQNPLSSCQVCNPAMTQNGWSATNEGGTCDDGQACTFNDTCASGFCQGTTYSCLPATGQTCLVSGTCTGKAPDRGGCSWTLEKDTCFIDNTCYQNGDKDTQNPCQKCNPHASTSAWTPIAGCAPPSVCGNGKVESGEQCDGGVGERQCKDLGFAGGTLDCHRKGHPSACRFDTSGCTMCGNNTVDTSAGEACDGTDLGGKDCQSAGFYKGTLGCTSTCALDTSKCHNCGNGTLESGEACDGTAFPAGTTCQALGYGGGTLACTGACALDKSGCTTCGNGVVEGSEQCDGGVGSATCTSLGYAGGTQLACTSACTYDPSNCKFWKWATRVNGPSQVEAVGVAAGGDLFVGGRLRDTLFSPIQYKHLGKLTVGSMSKQLALTWSGGCYFTAELNRQTGAPAWLAGNKWGWYEGHVAAVVPSSTGHLYVAGDFGESMTVHLSGTAFAVDFPVDPPVKNRNDSFLMHQKSSDGTPTVFGSPNLGPGGEIWFRDMARDPAGDLYVVGNYTTASAKFGSKTLPAYSGGSQDGLVARYNTSQQSWAWVRPVWGSLSDSLTTVVVSGGTVYVGGSTRSSKVTSGTLSASRPAGAGGQDLLLATFDLQGNPQDLEVLGGPGNENVTALAVDQGGNVHMGGFFQSPSLTLDTGVVLKLSGTEDSFVARLGSSGGVAWGWNPASGACTGWDKVTALAGAKAGVYVGGQFKGTCKLGPTTLTPWTTGSDPEVYVARVDGSGRLVWVTAGGGSDDDIILDMAPHKDGGVVVGGAYESPWFYMGNALKLQRAHAYGDGFVAHVKAP